MNKKYETPKIDPLWLRDDVLTTSDNDFSFGGEDNDDQNWGQYY